MPIYNPKTIVMTTFEFQKPRTLLDQNFYTLINTLNQNLEKSYALREKILKDSL